MYLESNSSLDDAPVEESTGAFSSQANIAY